MAGSFNHVIDTDSGKLLANEPLVGMLENGGDVYEAVEEMYGMIWYLATVLASVVTEQTGDLVPPGGLVEEARENYQIGIERSPGVGGDLDDEDED